MLHNYGIKGEEFTTLSSQPDQLIMKLYHDLTIARPPGICYRIYCVLFTVHVHCVCIIAQGSSDYNYCDYHYMYMYMYRCVLDSTHLYSPKINK